MLFFLSEWWSWRLEMDRGIFAEEERGIGKETSDGRRYRQPGQKDPPRSARKGPKKKRQEKRIYIGGGPPTSSHMYTCIYLCIHTYMYVPRIASSDRTGSVRVRVHEDVYLQEI